MTFKGLILLVIGAVGVLALVVVAIITDGGNRPIFAQSITNDPVFNILADEGHPDKTGRIIWIRNTKTGECHLMTCMNSGTALAPALCQ